jgi:hypothetical protein
MADAGRNFVIRFTLLALILSPALLAQNTRDSFVIDKSKPFVYLVFDHVGPRKPAQEGEGADGLWLRVVNNCRLTILFRAQSYSSGDPSPVLDHEVVPEEPILQIWSTQKEGEAIKQEELARKEALKRKPGGHTSEASGVLRVQSGKEVLFSVPLDHVNRFWFTRLRFALDVEGSSIAAGPFTDLDFHEFEIPKGKR